LKLPTPLEGGKANSEVRRPGNAGPHQDRKARQQSVDIADCKVDLAGVIRQNLVQPVNDTATHAMPSQKVSLASIAIVA
jgi:hypothetical protein